MARDWTPNLIMPGVAKCGTTTLHDMLLAHPRIVGGTEKEVRFLMDKDDPLAGRKNYHNAGLAHWAKQYQDGGQGDYDYWLDASPQYQYQATALEVIPSLKPAPRLLWIFRKPSARLYSLYQYARYQQRAIPHIHSFEQFIQEIRTPVSNEIAGRPMLANAWQDTHYDRMLAKWQDAVPAANIHCLTLESLIADRLGALSRIAVWLGLAPEPFTDPVVVQSNPTIVTRSKLLQAAGFRLSGLLPDIALVRKMKSALKRLNEGDVDSSEKSDNAALLVALDREFAPAMRNLEAERGLSW